MPPRSRWRWRVSLAATCLLSVATLTACDPGLSASSANTSSDDQSAVAYSRHYRDAPDRRRGDTTRGTSPTTSTAPPTVRPPVATTTAPPPPATTTTGTATTEQVASTSSGGPLRNSPAQPATILYDGDAGLDAYAKPGALVVAGRANYADAGFTKVSAAGGTVLVYLDPIIGNPYGRYATLLMTNSSCGPAVGSWPGHSAANQYGTLNDFREGGVLQQKLQCVLETMVKENPHMGGFFADDVGSRSYFPAVGWDSWSAADKTAYRNGAIAITKTFRKVADEHGLVVMVNGAWNGGPVTTQGGGYPDASQSGTSMADGGMIENLDQNLPYMKGYSCSKQWAAASAVTKGMSFNYATTRSTSARSSYATQACVAWVGTQGSYDTVAQAWGTFHATGLPAGPAG